MEKFINEKSYTDVTSYRVFDINEKKGTAMAIEVERVFKPKFVEGGFSAICINQDEQHNAPIRDKKGAIAFAITRNSKGILGVKHDDVIYCLLCNTFKPEGIKELMDRGNARIVKNVSDGRDMIEVFRKTKSGKVGKTFTKLGKLENSCKAFYDYNF